MIGFNPITLLATCLLVSSTIARPFSDDGLASRTPANSGNTVSINKFSGVLSTLKEIGLPPILHKQKRHRKLPITTTLTERQDSLNLQLQGPDGVCTTFGFSGSTFSASCFSPTIGSPVPSSIDLNGGYENSFGTLQPLINGYAFKSCSACSLATDTLDLTCNCATGAPQESVSSTINLDGTTEYNGNGVFVQDNGKLALRAPATV